MRLIDADLAIAKCNEDIEAVKDIPQRVDGILDAIMNIHECPTIEERKNGKWMGEPKDGIEAMFFNPKCSVCGFESAEVKNFCPMCGAKMDGEEDDD